MSIAYDRNCDAAGRQAREARAAVGRECEQRAGVIACELDGA